MRIKKTASQKHEQTLSPFVRDFLSKAVDICDKDKRSGLTDYLATFPSIWPFPRGDLYHWIPLLNKFDEVLEELVSKYNLKAGPQQIPFEPEDETILISILDFSRLLIEECGNRSLYASSSHLNDLLNTISYPLLTSVLRLGQKLAQRYHSSRSRTGALSTTANNALLTNHYNINLEKVTKLAGAFVSNSPTSSTQAPAKVPLKPLVAANDLHKLATDISEPGKPAGKGKNPASLDGSSSDAWSVYGPVTFTYYVHPTAPTKLTPPEKTKTPSQTPRKASNLSKEQSAKPDLSFDEAVSGIGESKSTSSGVQSLEIPASVIQTTDIIEILKNELPKIPAEYHYEFLQRLRVAKAFAESAESRRQILGIRILAVTNLAYVLSESNFQTKVLASDTDEPRRFQLVFQLADLVSPLGGRNVPKILQTYAFAGLEALAKCKTRNADVNNALGLNVSHGTLLTLLRKAISDLGDEEKGNDLNPSKEDEEWRKSLFDLTSSLPSQQVSGGLLVGAGLIGCLVSVLNLRTYKGIPYIPKALQFLDGLVYGIPTAFTNFANANGLDAMVELIHWQVTTAIVEAKVPGGALPEEYRSPSTDFQTGWYHAYILKMAFKFTHHMLGQTGNTSERLLRNLIDSPRLLDALRQVIANAKMFGSSVWSSAVNTLTTFIHNEPTSYQIIHEARLSHGLFAAVTGQPIESFIEENSSPVRERTSEMEENSSTQDTQIIDADQSENTNPPTNNSEQNPVPATDPATANPESQKTTQPEPSLLVENPASTILPAYDVMNTIPLAFGAICLINSGLELFKSSNALEKFFEIFESPEHVKCMSDSDISTALGSAFDELIRHQPSLKDDIMKVIIKMVSKVIELGNRFAQKDGAGAKVFLEENGEFVVSGGRKALNGAHRRSTRVDVPRNDDLSDTDDSDVEMAEDEEGSGGSGSSNTARPTADTTEANMPDLVPDNTPNEKVLLADLKEEDDSDSPYPAISISNYIDVMSRFLEGFLSHHSHTRDFVKRGGFDKLIAIYFLPSLPYDFAARAVSLAMTRVMHLCCEASPTTTIPTLLGNTEKAIKDLEPLLKHESKDAFFKPLTTPPNKSDSEASGKQTVDESVDLAKARGTDLIKDLVTAHALTTLLSELYSQTLYNTRATSQLFQPVAQRTFYETLVPSLGALHRACVWEEILLQRNLPDTWKEATKFKDMLGFSPDDEIIGPDGQELPQKTAQEKRDEKEAAEKAVTESEGKTPWFLNVKTIRFLISQIPSSITPFFQGLARVLVTRRTTDQNHKKHAFKISDSISDVMFQHLTWKRVEHCDSVTDRYSYLIIILSAISSLILEGGDRNGTCQIISIVLITFKQNNGLKSMTEILETFWKDVQEIEVATSDLNQRNRLAHCFGGIKVILSLFTQLVNSKSVLESPQTTHLHYSRERDRDRPDYFNAHQFLVELRALILPAIEDMWNSPSIEKVFPTIVKSVVEILGTVLKAENEAGAYQRRDKGKHPTMISWRSFEPNEDHVRQLTDMGFDREAALSALLRAHNNLATATEWLLSHPEEAGRSGGSGLRQSNADEDSNSSDSEADTDVDAIADLATNQTQPAASASILPPASDILQSRIGDDQINDLLMNLANATVPPGNTPPILTSQPQESSQTSPPTIISTIIPATVSPAPPQVDPPAVSSEAATPARTSLAGILNPTDVAPAPPTTEGDDGLMAMSIDDLPAAGLAVPIVTPQGAQSTASSTPAPPAEDKGKGKDSTEATSEPTVPVITIEDLDDMRTKISKGLVDRAIEILNTQHDVTFELSNLVTNAYSKGNEETRREAVTTIFQMLMSLQLDDDIRPQGKTITAVAHFLGLVLQNQAFFNSALDEYNDQLPIVTAYIKIYQNEPCPWIGRILLVIEKFLIESSQPKQVEFIPPDSDENTTRAPIVPGFTVELEQQINIFNAVMSTLPSVAKDENTALAIVRVLVLLTRKREIALKMGEYQNINRLFHMFKNMAGCETSKIRSCIMLIVRHIIEDDETVKTFMAAEIRTFFKNRGSRGSRQIDPATYCRQCSHLVLRNPDIFVETTSELCKLVNYQPSIRHQQIVLKDSDDKDDDLFGEARKVEGDKPEGEQAEASGSGSATAETDKGKGVDKGAAPTETSVPKLKIVTEVKPPGVEKPDGVVHYLLCELLSIKDADPNEGAPASPVEEKPAPAAEKKETGGDVEMTTDENTSSAPSPPQEKSTKPEKPEFKGAEHPNYLYRCFLLQALTEILASYNRSKLEFINFSRRANARDPITPSKPRTGILNYLLSDLIPVGTLSQPDDTTFKKRTMTSNWAISVVVSLCAHTGEIANVDDEPDLIFVRKHVLDASIKAFKDAGASSEHLDAKYARMLNLSDLLYRMLASRPNASQNNILLEKSQKQLAKIMFEKNFVNALTNSLAEIDLNFPSARRVIKYILRPLKLLSKTALDLGEEELNILGAEDDDISMESLSQIDDDEREETPNLFQNSALGMLEGGLQEDEDEYGDEDDEMYIDEMEYDDEEEEDSQASDEDEMLDDRAGEHMDVEIVVDDGNPDSEDDDEDMSDDDDDDMDDDDDDDELHDELPPEVQRELSYQDEEEDWEASDVDDGHLVEMMPGDNEGLIDHVNRVIAGEAELAEELMEEREDAFIEDPEDDDEDEEEEEELEEEEAVAQDDEAEDDEDEMGIPWEWTDEYDAPLMARARHPGPQNHGWYTIGGNSRDIILTGGTGRPAEENMQNPLLQPTAQATHNRAPVHRHGHGGEWINAFDAFDTPVMGGPGAVSWLTSLMNIVGRAHNLPATMAAGGGTLQFHIQAAPGGGGIFPPEIEALLNIRRPTHDHRSREQRVDPLSAVAFTPYSTIQRWLDESRLGWGSGSQDIASRVLNAVLGCIVPPAIEEEKARKEKEERERKEEEEARLKLEEEERLAREKAEEEEKKRKEEEERKRKEEEEARAAEEAARAAEAGEAAAAAAAAAASEGAMEGVEPSQAQTAGASDAGPSEQPPARAVTYIRGREVDITGMDIDPEFLEALPDDMREEVLTQHIRERQAASSTADQANEISPEFLEALPEDIRDEIIQQQQADQRRREREAARAASGQARGPADMDLATFLATLDPSLRQQVLLEQSDEVLAHLPEGIVAETNALRDRTRVQQLPDITRVVRPRPEDIPRIVPEKKVRKQSPQMLDKAGVATLLRLMFIPQQGSTKISLHEILLNICDNKVTRNEVLGLLLSVLQDGSTDMNAVERSFAHLSLRAKQTSTKTPISALKKTPSIPLPQTNSEMSPLMVAQQCLAAIAFLVNLNDHISAFFLNEHDINYGLKRSQSRKGKGKENQQSKANRFALNSLLGLLERPLMTESSGFMEQLATLLSEITRPLVLLLKRDKKKQLEDKKAEDEKKEGENQEQQTQEGQTSTESTTGTADANGQNATSTADVGGNTATGVSNTSTENQSSTGEVQQTSQPPGSDTAPIVPPIVTEQPTTTSAPSEKPTEESKEKPKDDAKPTHSKKSKGLQAPVVPDQNLCLVVGIITNRECTSKTFRETLTTMVNLSAIPGAKDVFGAELIRQAQLLGGTILDSLSELSVHLRKAESGAEIEGLASFSQGSSDQAKLLRTLTALDYLYDRDGARRKKREDQSNEDTSGDSKNEESGPTDAEVLARLYENLSFGPLWSRLSECLTIIHDREDMLHVATILLPIIESLMVVCRNSGLNTKRGPAVAAAGQAESQAITLSQTQREKTPVSAATDASMEALFFTFTETHRKILNQMVRNNPKLMSGSFDLLVHNPKVLDFDNKRNYFNRKLHTRNSAREQHYPSLQLHVRRDQVFLDSYRSMHYKRGDEIKYSKLNIRFQGEEGVDAGGVTREWFQVLARQMFNPDYALFLPVASDRTTFHPNNMSGVNPEHLSFFKFIGRVIGKALYENRVLDCHFSRAMYKRILGRNVSLKDMENLDLDYYKSLQWMLDNESADIMMLNFSIETDEFGVEKIVDLVPGGRDIPVTDENKHEYVKLMIEYKLLNSVKEQMDNFLQGFHDIVPAELVAIFGEQELELLISGLPDIDVDDWRNNTEYHNYSASSPQVQWFWRAVRSFDKEEQAKLLQFVTGTSKVPLNGFKELEGMNGYAKFNIHRDYGNKERLPSSHTCFNQIDLPEYESYEHLRKNLLTAITAGAEYFGFA